MAFANKAMARLSRRRCPPVVCGLLLFIQIARLASGAAPDGVTGLDLSDAIDEEFVIMMCRQDNPLLAMSYLEAVIEEVRCAPPMLLRAPRPPPNTSVGTALVTRSYVLTRNGPALCTYISTTSGKKITTDRLHPTPTPTRCRPRNLNARPYLGFAIG